MKCTYPLVIVTLGDKSVDVHTGAGGGGEMSKIMILNLNWLKRK